MPKKAVNESPEMRELLAQLEEAQETLNAIRRGEVDGLVVSTPKGEQVYSISGAETPYRVLMENMREGAITLSDDNTILYCNLGFAKMMKVPLEKIVGSNIENKISPTFKILFKELLAKCRSGPKQEAETKGITFIADDKTLVPTQISVNSLNMDHTTTTFIVVTDLTQHMEEDLKRYTSDLEKAGAALFESEQRWSTTLGSIADAVIATDIAGKITYMNDVAEELTGWPLEKASGKPVQTVFKIISAATRKIVDDPVAKVLKKGQIVGLANHTTLIRQNGTEVPIDDSGAPIKDKEGKTTGVVLIFRDITERKRAEEALRYNELLLTGFFDSIGHMRGIVEVINDKDIRHVKDNEVTASYVGLTPADFKGKLSSELGEPAERIKTWIEHYKQSQKTGKPVTWEYTDRERSKVTWLSPTVTYIGKSSEGNPRFTYVVTDITERKKAEEELKRSEENARQRAEELRKLMDIIPAAVWLSRDPECKVIVGNQAANTFYEAEGEENVSAGPASGKAQDTTRRFFHNGKELMPQELPMQEAAAKNVEIKNSELEVIVPSGRKIAILGNAKPLLDDVGKVRGCLGAFVDITERKKAEETLTKKQDELQTIIDSSQGLIFYKDRENHFIRVNKAFAKIMGLPKEQLEGRSLFEIYPKEEAEAFWSDDKQVIASGKAKVGIEEKMQSKQGQRWVQTDKIPYRDAEGNIIGVIGFTVDITERKKGDEALKQAQEKLQEYATSLERLVEERTKQLQEKERLATIGATAGMVGHDIRNPLQAIIGDLYLAKEEIKEVPNTESKRAMQESLAEIEKNVDYINKIVADLQDYSRVIAPAAQEVDLSILFEEVLLESCIPENIQASVRIEPDASILISDSTLIKRILSNLTSNAVQAMPKGGKLTIETHKNSGDVVIIVEDTGVGIANEVKEKLFTPMFTTKSKGQGFGLAVVKRMTEALGGSVTFESEVGKGTKFIIRFPAQKS